MATTDEAHFAAAEFDLAPKCRFGIGAEADLVETCSPMRSGAVAACPHCSQTTEEETFL